MKRIINYKCLKRILFPNPHYKILMIYTQITKQMANYIYQFSRAAMTKYYRLGGLNNRTLFLHSSEGQKSKIQVSAELVSSSVSLLALQMVFLYQFFSCGHPSEHVCVLISSLHKDTSHIGFVPSLIICLMTLSLNAVIY